jgi:hypothetical protein
MKKLSLLLVFVLGFTLAACDSTQITRISKPPTVVGGSSADPAPQKDSSQGMTLSDDQGAVTVKVKPDNLRNPGNALVFEISMSTHSVELSMDLASLATLTTDNGRTVQATVWNAPRGGHHVSGTLSFPAIVDGTPILDGATKLTLTIKDVDAQERVFTWEKPQ